MNLRYKLSNLIVKNCNVITVNLGSPTRRFCIVFYKARKEHQYKLVKIKSPHFPPHGIRLILPTFALEYWY